LTAGLISIGTNSTRALVVRFDSGVPQKLVARSVGTRIGEGLRERGHLEPDAMQRTLDAIAEHAQAIREHTPEFRIIATSALRRADNEAEFEERVRALTGRGVTIISGEEEAACSFAGAVSGIDLPPDYRFGVLDVGGGSSEYAIGTKDGPQHVVSCEIGAVRITEHYPVLAGTSGPVPMDTLRDVAEYALEMLAPAVHTMPVKPLVLVGGSATTLVSVERGHRESFDYADVWARDVRAWVERLASTPLDERKRLPGINPQRADILLGGLLLINTFFEGAGNEGALVSTNDVLLGYLLRHPAER
jgi:exopolyphosphatase/guanosine-5'-triphosphate,3'-diphosphate pyrophosphatase